jgi:hypothetical protein
MKDVHTCCVVFPVWFQVEFDSKKETQEEIREKVMKAAEHYLQTSTVKGVFVECSDAMVDLD